MSEQFLGGSILATSNQVLGVTEHSTADSNPKVDISTGRKVEARIVREAATTGCDFWLGLMQQGAHKPLDLLGKSTVDEIFKLAANDGVREDGPVVLFDSVAEKTLGLLLMPVPDANFRNRTLWVEKLTATLTPWGPQRLGIYLAPEILGPDPKMELLTTILRAVIQNSYLNEIFLLTGNHGTNLLLNALVRLRQELLSENFELYVYH